MPSRKPHQGQASRRDVLRAGAGIAAGYWLGTGQPRPARAASDKLHVAVIGVGGRGTANLAGVRGENVIALCDVDSVRASGAFNLYPKTPKFKDFRRLYDAHEKDIDAVVISTPDHTHFHPAYRALEMGKHVYLEKPMAHSVWECRQLTNLAKAQGVATQLGVQRHTLANVHRVVELIQAGAIGDVHEVHCWIGGSRGMPGMPQDKPDTPAHLDWDLWMGPAAERPYHPAYAPYGWRFWWDFGTGETGNWGCHILDIPYWALGLRYPTRVGAGKGPEPHPQMTPKAMDTWMEFPAEGKRGPVKLFWSHAKNGPDKLRELGLAGGGHNTLFLGSKGMLLCGFGKHALLPEEDFVGYQRPQKTIPNSPGFHREWIAACKGGPEATCHFGYSGPMAETVLLGNVAYRSQSEFAWDAEKLEADQSQAQAMIRSEFRKGWEV